MTHTQHANKCCAVRNVLGRIALFARARAARHASLTSNAARRPPPFYFNSTRVEADGLVHQPRANRTRHFLEVFSALETARLVAARTKGNLHERTHTHISSNEYVLRVCPVF